MIKDSFERDGITYIRLDMCCPVDERFNGHNSHLWQHAGCGGDMYLGDNATFYCSKCKESIPCIKAKFESPTCSRTADEFIISNSDRSILTVADLFSCTIACIIAKHMSLDFLKRFIQSLDAQYE